MAQEIESALSSYGVMGRVIEIELHDGNVRFYLQTATGVRVRKVMDLKDDIAIAIAAQDLNMEIAPEKQAIAIDIPD